MELYDVMKKLIGPTIPVGEMYEDERRFKNLKELTDLVDVLTEDIFEVAVLAERPEHSINKAGKHAYGFLVEMHEWLEDNNVEEK